MQKLSFNQTRMELKRVKDTGMLSGTNTFNQTRMELKLFMKWRWSMFLRQLLIRPEWN